MIKISNTQDYELDLPLKKIGIVFLILVAGFVIGYMFKPNEELIVTNQDILELVDFYVLTEEFCVGPLCLNEDMTLYDIRQLYLKFRNQPTADDVVISHYKMICKLG